MVARRTGSSRQPPTVVIRVRGSRVDGGKTPVRSRPPCRRLVLHRTSTPLDRTVRPRGRPAAQQATCAVHVSCTLARTMTTISPDIDLAALIADTEAEILRARRRPRPVDRTALYEMVRYHLGLDGSGASARQADAAAARPARLPLDRGRPPRGPCPAPRPSSWATTSASSTTTSRTATSSAATGRRSGPSTACPGDQHRRHAVHPVADRAPSADATSGSRDAKVLRADAPVRRDLPRPVRGPVHRHLRRASTDELMSVELYFDMIGRKTAALIAGVDRGGRAAGHRRRRRSSRATAASAGRWASRSSSTTTCSGIWGEEQATGKEPSDLAQAQEDAAGASTRSSTPAPRTGPGCASSMPPADPTPTDVAEVVAILERAGAREYTRDRGPPLPRRGAGRARRRGRRRGRRRADAPRTDHRLGHHRLRSPAPAPGPLTAAARSRASGRTRRRSGVAWLAHDQHLAHAPAVGRLDGQASARRPRPRRPASGTPPMRW